VLLQLNPGAVAFTPKAPPPAGLTTSAMIQVPLSLVTAVVRPCDLDAGMVSAIETAYLGASHRRMPDGWQRNNSWHFVEGLRTTRESAVCGAVWCGVCWQHACVWSCMLSVRMWLATAEVCRSAVYYVSVCVGQCFSAGYATEWCCMCVERAHALGKS
jgi:hypothetical protein